MQESNLAIVAVAWLASYAVHSTLLLVAALAASRLVRRPGQEDLLWKVALLGGIATATVATLAPGNPLAGRITLAARRLPAAAEIDPRPRALPVELPADGAAPAPTSTAVAAAAAVDATPRTGPAWPGIVLLTVAIGTVTSLALLALSYFRLHLRISGRWPVLDLRLRTLARMLAERQGRPVPLRLSATDAIDVPMALPGSEVCLPGSLGDAMDDDAQAAALAHEVAHVLRRDPAWLLAMRTIEALFFFQPLNRIARRRWQECTELLCDDWAATRIGAPLQMARSLTDAAAYVVDNDLPLPAMARCRSTLTRRVLRLVDPEWSPSTPASARDAGLAALLLLAVACAAPAVAPPPSPDTTLADAKTDTATKTSAAEAGTPPPAVADVAESPVTDAGEPLEPLPTWREPETVQEMQVLPADDGTNYEDPSFTAGLAFPAAPAFPVEPMFPVEPGFPAQLAFPAIPEVNVFPGMPVEAFMVEMPDLPEFPELPEVPGLAALADGAVWADPAFAAELAGSDEAAALAREQFERAVEEQRRGWEEQRREAIQAMQRDRHLLESHREAMVAEAHQLAEEQARLARELAAHDAERSAATSQEAERLSAERERLAEERAAIERERDQLRREREELQQAAGELRRAIEELEAITK